jgi:type 1 glutamine amidotransferase
MEHGGGWIGYHVAGYNDKTTNWPWFVNFLGGAVFYTNNWPPLPAKLVVDDLSHPVTRGLPASYDSPANEWYLWKPSPRLDRNVRVLVTLAQSNYPLGVKDIITEGDLPVVWTNTKYRMLYMNMGHGAHGEKVYSDPTQNQLFSNAIMWLGERK